MKISEASQVELEYRLFAEDGSEVENSDDGEFLCYQQGSGEIPLELEQALLGKSVGDELKVELEAGVAFGDFDPALIVSVPRSELPEEVELKVGDFLPVTLENEDEEDSLEMRIMEVDPDGVVLDGNHPMAGKAVRFELRVREISAG